MKLKLLAFAFIANVALYAQHKTVTTSMGSGYANDVYYSLDNGVVKTSDRTGWDIAFNTTKYDVIIRANVAGGTSLYIASDDTTDWATLDTTGMSWTPLYNSEKTWMDGAFNSNPVGAYNYGWGSYNTTTHSTIGSRIFVMKTAAGNYKKVFIQEYAGGIFTFKTADLDGSNEVKRMLNSASYTDQYFAYYDVVNDSAFSKEPKQTEWDFVFTKYMSEVAPGTSYPVTGVFLNEQTKANRAEGEDTNMVAWRDHQVMDTTINLIGYDWKSFSGGTYVCADSLSYFIESQGKHIYKVVFKSFSGSTAGDITFTTSLESALSIEDNSILTMSVYPNPATSILNITSESNTNVQVMNLNGSIVKNVEVNGSARIDVSDLSSGTYILRAQSNEKVYQTKLIIL